MAIGQCRSGGITVATVAPAHGAEDVVPDNEISGGPPFDMGLTMLAQKKKKKIISDEGIQPDKEKYAAISRFP